MLNFLKKVSPKWLKEFCKRIMAAYEWDQWHEKSWSQEGEDQILRRIFERSSLGFYVDVGAHHPKRFSNTYLFYKRGWRGINIDAMPNSMDKFKKTRPRDINIEVGVGINSCELEYYFFDEPAFNGFNKNLSHKRGELNNQQKINFSKFIKVEPLSKILDKYMPPMQAIDFMTIDVEGLDFCVLKSNDWIRYRPKFVLVEILDCNLEELYKTEIGEFMRNQGYGFYAKCKNTIFFNRNT
jgi:FkbM family methyltransferase